MQSDTQRAREDQVFLIMGVCEHAKSAECAIVMAIDLAAAKRAFVRQFVDYVPMTWPSLRDIRYSLDMLETARDGGFPDELKVINVLPSDKKGKR